MRKAITIILLLTCHLLPAQTTLPTIQQCDHSSKIAAYKAFVGHSFMQGDFRAEFCTKELMDKYLNMGIVKNSNALTCRLSHYGYSLFGELTLQLGYARNFGHKLSVSLQGIYLMQHATHYECRHSFTVDVSLAYLISNRLCLAIEVYNPIRMRYGITGKEIIPMEFYVEACYHQNDKVAATLFCQKKLPGSLDLGLEIGYQPLTSLAIIGNCSLHKCGIGIDILWRKFVFRIQSDWYYQISFSPESNILFIL